MFMPICTHLISKLDALQFPNDIHVFALVVLIKKNHSDTC